MVDIKGGIVATYGAAFSGIFGFVFGQLLVVPYVMLVVAIKN